ncbi:hypothetical protein [Paenibacillus endoradicis]|uniref:hypothetical protein n=1 Tax=Paenibacillus endoradicis TaxID=2972487 RepID=UPI0021598736|nr:hypothetical protein [Paenibacillus endoradicis]MCR8656448.1 hypothetical protein [Paenibacillus endoradicis]
MRTIACLVILLLALTGCTTELQTSVPEKKDEPTEITLTPVELFKGEEAKYKPFLGNMCGAFKLSYKGNKPNANLDIDIWKNGEKVESSGSLGDLFFSSENLESTEIEIIISIDTISMEGQDDVNQVKVSKMNGSGSSTAIYTIPRDKELITRGLLNNPNVLTFTTENSVPLWGMQSTSGNYISGGDLSTESLIKLEHAIIFTLRFED